MKDSQYPRSARNARSVNCVTGGLPGAGGGARSAAARNSAASRLNRTMSESMPRNPDDVYVAGDASKPASPPEPHSTAPPLRDTANDMSDGSVSTPSVLNRPTRLG